METALVHRNLTDLTSKPHYLAERKTQALFGEFLTILELREEYALVEQADGYEGWARVAALTEFEETISGESWLVTDPVAPIYDESGEQTAPYFLTYGAAVRPIQTDEYSSSTNNSNLAKLLAPDGRELWIDSSAISKPANPEKLDRSAMAESILNAAKEFLGAPYLWGGNSPLGLDCSALAQLVFAAHGITLPRDSSDQRKVGTEVLRDDLLPADLIFSPGHIVIYAGDQRFIHASLGEGGVTLNSYDQAAGDYRADLDNDFLIARRLF